ncbi:MAG: hypothetical protein AAGF04_02425 [Chlamydiota bacterium]
MKLQASIVLYFLLSFPVPVFSFAEGHPAYSPDPIIQEPLDLPDPHFHHGYRITRMSLFADIFYTNNGAGWKVNPNYHSILQNWDMHDTVVVTQNSHYFSDPFYKYIMINTKDFSEIEVHLESSPNRDNIYTHSIKYVNSQNGLLLLQNGSLWKVVQADLSVIDKWRSSDIVLVGQNAECCCASSHILINTSMHDPYTHNRDLARVDLVRAN